MGLFEMFKKKAGKENSITTQPKTYICARCKREITDEESEWIGNHRFCVDCATAPANNTPKKQDGHSAYGKDKKTDAVRVLRKSIISKELNGSENTLRTQYSIRPKRFDMPPEQIEQLAHQDLVNICWESGNGIASATTYAQFLFQSYFYYFYVSETGTFFSVEQDGNYYHGYETIVKKCSKAEVLSAATNNLALARNSLHKDNSVPHWEKMCSLIEKC